MTRKVAEAIVRLLERAEESEAHGDVNRARELLEELVVAIDADSDVRSMTRCVELATRIGDHNLALHYALCVWCARPGQSAGHRAVSGAALCHPDRRVSGAGYRICLHRARSSDWHAIATADPYSAWPRITDICDHGAGGAPSVVDLSNANLMRRIGPKGTGVWTVKRARLTQAGRSVAIGVQETAPNGRPAFVSALSVWDPSAALRWDRPPTDAFNRLGVLATRFSYSGYWHWLFEGLSYAVRLDEEGLLASLDRLVICFNNTPPRYVDESLEAVGIPCSKVSATSTPFDFATSELIIPVRAPGFGGLIDESETTLTLREIKLRNAQYGNDADLRAVRRRLGLGLDGAGGIRGSRRLLVSRRDAAKRRVVNEDALLSALKGLGFELVVPGTLPFSEQVATFSEAQVVVGPHGAGLANALFMPKGSAMLELHHPGFGRPYYRRLADTVGVRYQSLACEPAPASPRDMVAAVDQATETVRTLLTQVAR